MLTCFLCEKSGIVKKFTNETLLKCHEIRVIRLKTNLKYKKIALPRNLKEKGYHVQCFRKFMDINSTHGNDLDSMISNTANNSRRGQKPQVNTKPKLNKSIKATPKTSIQNCIEIEVPELVEIDAIKTEIDPTDTCDITLDIPEVPVINVPIENLTMYQVDEPTYVNPDISRGVILKSILTRKTPIRRDMTNDSSAFGSGMDLFKYGTGLDDNQAILNFVPETLISKIAKPTSLSVCLLCNKEQRKIGTQVEMPDSLSKKDCTKKVLSYAEAMNDTKLIEKIKLNKTYTFHPLCRIEYRNIYETVSKKNCDEKDWSVYKNVYNEAFKGLSVYLDEHIIQRNKSFMLCDLLERYKAMLFEIQNSKSPFDFESYRIQYLQDKILCQYYGIIDITTSKTLKRKVVHKKGAIDFNSAAKANDEFKKYDKLAFDLRNAIKSMKRTSSGRNDEIPEKLTQFVTCLIQGPDDRKKSYESCAKINSVCKDIMSKINMDD